MPLRTNSNPLPEIDSRWIAHNRKGVIVVVDNVYFDAVRREKRIKYHEEESGNRGSTWHGTFRQPCAFSPVTPAAPVPQLALPLAVAPTPPPAPTSEQRPSCVECGAPCQKRTHSRTWRSTCSEECAAKARAGLLVKANAALDAMRSAAHPPALVPASVGQGPSCRECGAPCQRRKSGGGWRSTCSGKCLADYRTGMMAKGHAAQAAARNTAGELAPEQPTRLAAVREKGIMRSEYLSVRMPPETKAAMERIRDEYNSKAGPGPRKTWTTAELLTSAIMEAAERWGAQLDAEKAAGVKPRAHLRSVT